MEEDGDGLDLARGAVAEPGLTSGVTDLEAVGDDAELPDVGVLDVVAAPVLVDDGVPPAEDDGVEADVAF